MKKLCYILYVLLISAIQSNSVNSLHADPRKMNDDTGTAVQSDVASAMSVYGYGVLCWTDSRNGHEDIYFQIYTAKGFLLKTNLKANDDKARKAQRSPDVGMNDRGNFVIVWEDERNGDKDIYAQRFESNGNPIGANLRVNDDQTTTDQEDPAVGMDAAGNFIVCWTQRNADMTSFIHARRFDHKGNALGSSFAASPANSFLQFLPAIDMNRTGTFVIVWNESVGPSMYDIYAQRFDHEGNARGNKFEVSEHLFQTGWTHYPSVAIRMSGDFMIFWTYTPQSGYHDLYGRLYRADGTPVSDPFLADLPDGSTEDQNPCVYASPLSGYLVVWSRFYHSSWDIFSQAYDNNGNSMGYDRMTDDRGSERKPSVVLDMRANTILAWEDNREGNSDIYADWQGPEMVLNVKAGSGHNSIIPITWDPVYGNDDIINYTIRRSTNPGGPFDQVAIVDPSKRLLPRLMLDWIDQKVQNGTIYYYTIETAETDYPSRTVMAAPSAEGHSIHARWAQLSATVDGHLADGEWDDAVALNIASPYAPESVTLYIKNSWNSLYIAVDDPNDEILDPGNYLGILFDEDNDNTWDPSGMIGEGALTINSTNAYFTSYYGEYPDHLGAAAPVVASGISGAVSISSGHVQYEAVIDMTSSPLQTQPGDVIGAGFWITDPGNHYPIHYGNAGEWPDCMLWEAALPLGDLILATESDTIPDDTTTMVDWPMMNGCKERTSWAKGETSLYPPFAQIHEYPVQGKTATEISYRDPLLYVGTESTPNSVYAFMFDSGSELWNYIIPGTTGDIGCTPASNESMLFFGGQDGPGLIGIDRWNRGARWMKDVGSLFLRSPIVDNDRIYLVKDSLYCISANTGNTLWSFPISSKGMPTIDDQNVYFIGSNQLFALDKMNGTMKWHRPNNGYTIVADDPYLYTSHDDTLMCRMKSDGSIQGKQTMSGISIAGSANIIAVDDRHVCVSVYVTRHLYTFNKMTGLYSWSHEFSAGYPSTPTIANGVVYVVVGDREENVSGKLWGFDLVTGDSLFYDDSEDYQGQPIVANHTLFVPAVNKVKAFRNSPVSVQPVVHAALPKDYQLAQNYPNPFNPETVIGYDLPRISTVELSVFNLEGKRVRTLVKNAQTAGAHSVTWNGKDDRGCSVASGIYLYQFKAGNHVIVKKMMLLR